MNFVETPLKGAYVMEPVKIPDERGWFMTAFTEEELRGRGLESRWAQCSVSHSTLVHCVASSRKGNVITSTEVPSGTQNPNSANGNSAARNHAAPHSNPVSP